MNLNDIPLNEKVAVYLITGGIIGGIVVERNKDWVRLRDAFDINEEKVSGPMGAYYGKGLARGRVEIPFTSVSHWVTLNSIGLS